MKQVTLVSLYGQKPKPLADLIRNCMSMIQATKLRRIFSPYQLNQIHGTVMGMEKLIGYADHFNANLWASTSPAKKEVMNFAPLVHTVQRHLPIMVQFGNFRPTFADFLSSKERPYVRSFQVQWMTNKFTLIGWPHKNGDFTSTRLLDTLRAEIKSACNIQHKYAEDNDLFIVLGEISGLNLLTDSELAEMKAAGLELETQVRDYLETQKVEIEIGAEQVFVAQYEKETLPLESTNAYCLADSRSTGSLIDRLYDES